MTTMSNSHNTIVPAVSLANLKSRTPSKTSSPTGSVNLNPDAMTFAPGQSIAKNLSVNALDFVPKFASLSPFNDIKEGIADKDDALDFAMLESATAKDFTNPFTQAFDEKVHFVSESGTFVLICNTQDVSQSPLSCDVLAKLVAANDLPHKVQLIIFAGPRLQHIHNAARWFIETMGSSMRTVHRVQAVIVRRGEYMSGKWVIPQLDFEKFEPLHHFVAELIQVLPKHVDIIWGASEELALALRKHYLSVAVPNYQNAIEKDSDEGVTRYSESISNAALKSIASQYLHLQGKKTYPMFDSNPSTATYVNTPLLNLDRSGAFSNASILNPDASPFSPGSSQEAKLFTPAPVYNCPLSLYMPHRHHLASLPIDPYDPFNKQLYEIDSNRHGWVPSVHNHDMQYDSIVMYDYNENMARVAPPVNLEGLPVDYMHSSNLHVPMQMPLYGAQALSYTINTTPPPAYPGNSAMAPYTNHVYATASQYAQLSLGKKGKKGGYKKGGKPRRNQDLDPNYDAGFGPHSPFANDGCDTYGFAVPRHPHNGNGFDVASSNEYNTYLRTYSASFKTGKGHGNGNGYGYDNGYAGPESRGARPKNKWNKQKFNKKNQQNENARDWHQNRHAGDRRMNGNLELPHKDEYTRNRFHNDYPSDGPLNANRFIPPSFQNPLQLPRQQDDYRNASDSFDDSAQFPQQDVRAKYCHESRTSDSSTSIEFSSSSITELPKPVRGASDLPLKDTYGKITNVCGELESVDLASKAVGGGNVAKVDAVEVDLPLKITYADVAKGKLVSKGASAAAKANTDEHDMGAFGDVGAGETRVQMDEEIKGKGEGESEGEIASSEAREIPLEHSMASW